MTAPQQQQSSQVLVTAAAAAGAATTTSRVSAVTAGMIANLFAAVNPYSTKQVREFAQRAGQIIIGSQRTVANVHTAAQQIALRAVGINTAVPVVIPDNVRGATVTFGGGKPKVHAPAQTTVDYDDGAERISKSDAAPERVFERAAVTFRYEKSVGKDDAAAGEAARRRIEETVDNNLILAARLASQQTLVRAAEKDERIVGYRRIIHPELAKGGVCGLCVTAADRVYKVEELQPIHNRCNCSIAPVTTAHDPGHTLNQGDLSKLYEHAGGKTSAKALKRTRYEIVQHHELGPVLTRTDTGEQIPYFSTTPPALPEPEPLSKPPRVKVKPEPAVPAPIPKPEPQLNLPKIGKPLSREADLALVNPRHKDSLQWQINCTRCATTIELEPAATTSPRRRNRAARPITTTPRFSTGGCRRTARRWPAWWATRVHMPPSTGSARPPRRSALSWRAASNRPRWLGSRRPARRR